jgi:flagellar biosynthetic protein FlhB
MAEGAEEFQEKTEQATPRHREESRKKGQVAKSMEVSSAALILFCFLTLNFLASYLYHQISSLLIGTLSDMSSIHLSMTNFRSLSFFWMLSFAKILLPIVLSLAVVALAVNFAQVGVVFSAEPLSPKLDKLNIVKGMKRIFSKQSLFNLVRDVIKLLIIGYVSYVTIKSEMHSYVPLADKDVWQILVFASKMVFRVAMRTALALIILSVLDYAFQKWQFEQGLRMTRHQLKEELKMTEGDPLIRSRIRRIQREMARRRMMKEVPQADVVVTNPASLAVALKYDAQRMSAPTVIAKGQRLLASKIKEIAIQHSIPIVEDKPLAQALYKAVEVGMQIPANLYRAVAEVLAYVYSLKRRKK